MNPFLHLFILLFLFSLLGHARASPPETSDYPVDSPPSLSAVSTFLAALDTTGRILNWHGYVAHNLNAAWNNIAKYLTNSEEQQHKVLEMAMRAGPDHSSPEFNSIFPEDMPVAQKNSLLAMGGRWINALNLLKHARKFLQDATNEWREYRLMANTLILDENKISASTPDSEVRQRLAAYVDHLMGFLFEPKMASDSLSKSTIERVAQDIRNNVASVVGVPNTFVMSDITTLVTGVRNGLNELTGHSDRTILDAGNKMTKQVNNLKEYLGIPVGGALQQVDDEIRETIEAIPFENAQSWQQAKNEIITKFRDEREIKTIIGERPLAKIRNVSTELTRIATSGTTFLQRFEDVVIQTRQGHELKALVSNYGNLTDTTDALQIKINTAKTALPTKAIPENPTACNMLELAHHAFKQLMELAEDSPMLQNDNWPQLYASTTLAAWNELAPRKAKNMEQLRQDITLFLSDIRREVTGNPNGAKVLSQLAKIRQICADSLVPQGTLVEMVEGLSKLADKPGVTPINFDHLRVCFGLSEKVNSEAALIDLVKKRLASSSALQAPSADWLAIAQRQGIPMTGFNTQANFEACLQKHLASLASLSQTAPAPSTDIGSVLSSLADQLAQRSSVNSKWDCTNKCPLPKFGDETCTDILKWEEQVTRAIQHIADNNGSDAGRHALISFQEALCSSAAGWFKANRTSLETRIGKATTYGEAMQKLINALKENYGIDERETQARAEEAFNCNKITAECWPDFIMQFEYLADRAGYTLTDSGDSAIHVKNRLLAQLPWKYVIRLQDAASNLSETRDEDIRVRDLSWRQIRRILSTAWQRQLALPGLPACKDEGCKGGYTKDTCSCKTAAPIETDCADDCGCHILIAPLSSTRNFPPSCKPHTGVDTETWQEIVKEARSHGLRRFDSSPPFAKWTDDRGLCELCWHVKDLNKFRRAYPNDQGRPAFQAQRDTSSRLTTPRSTPTPSPSP